MGVPWFHSSSVFFEKTALVAAVRGGTPAPCPLWAFRRPLKGGFQDGSAGNLSASDFPLWAVGPLFTFPLIAKIIFLQVLYSKFKRLSIGSRAAEPSVSPPGRGKSFFFNPRDAGDGGHNHLGDPVAGQY